MPQNYVLPANAIKINGDPFEEEFEAAPGSAILPGDVVEFNTSYCANGEAKIKECAANSETFLGIAEQSHEGDKDDVFTAGDAVRVLSVKGVFAFRLAAASGVIVCGDLLKPAASGEVTLLECETGTHDPAHNACLLVAQARETKSNSTVVQWIIAKILR